MKKQYLGNLLVAFSIISLILIMISIIFTNATVIYMALIAVTILIVLIVIKIASNFRYGNISAIILFGGLGLSLFLWFNSFVNSVSNTAYLSDTDFRWSLMPLAILSMIICIAVLINSYLIKTNK